MFVLGVIFTVPALSQDAFAISVTISDEASCETIPGAIWSTPPNTCTLTSDQTISSVDTWTISPGVTLVISSGVTITSDGTILNDGTIDNFGTLKHLNAVLVTSGIFNNYGTVDNGTSGNIENNGVFNNICDYEYSGDPIQGNPPVFIPCDDPTPIVAGQIIPIESFSLLVAGINSTIWMIPALAGIAGTVIYLKFRKN